MSDKYAEAKRQADNIARLDRDELEGEVDANPLGAVDCMHEFSEHILALLADLHAANARADEAEVERDLWRKLAVHLALGAAESSLPTHFTTVSGIEDAATRFLASAMFCHDDGTRYKHPGDALDAAGKAMQSAAAREAVAK